MLTTKPEVEVLVNGKPVKIHAHEGRLFVEAKEGSEYTIKLRNNSLGRVEAVTSVDGLNVISGEIATQADVGYVLGAWGSYEIKGFRVSDDKVNAFAFGKKEQSYAAKSEATGGDTRDCGVIGVKFFSEKQKEPVFRNLPIAPSRPPRIPYPSFPDMFPRDPWRSPSPSRYGDVICRGGLGGGTQTSSQVMKMMDVDEPQMLCMSNAGSKGVFDMGTVFSDKEVEDKVTHTTFKRQIELAFVEIYYASRDQLIAMGVKLDNKPSVAFPSSFKPSGYCKPPKK